MKTAKVLRIAAGAMVVAAAVVGGYAVYHAERTEPVLVATREIPPFTVVNANDFTVESIPVSAVHSDALHSESGILGHMTTVGILPQAQVRTAMLSSSTSLQDLVNSVTSNQNVTFSLTYKEGQLQSFIPPDSYVNLVTQGPNNTMLHADHVLVLKNTGYESSPSSNGQNQNPMLILTLPEQTYMSMAQNLGNNNVQVLMIPQNGSSSTNSGQLTVTPTSSVPSTPPSGTGTSVTANSSNTTANTKNIASSAGPVSSTTKGAKK